MFGPDHLLRQRTQEEEEASIKTRQFILRKDKRGSCVPGLCGLFLEVKLGNPEP